MARLEQERLQRESVRRYSVTQALLDPKVLALSLVYFGAVATNYGLSFFLPQIVKAFGVSNFQAGLVSALPYVVGLVSIVLWGRRSDRKLERRFHLAFPLFVASAGIAISTALNDPTMKMVALSIAGFGIFGCLPVFWTFPAAFLSGRRGGRRDRTDQFDWQPGGLRRAVRDGAHQGRDRKLHRWLAVAFGGRLHRDDHCARPPTRPFAGTGSRRSARRIVRDADRPLGFRRFAYSL